MLITKTSSAELVLTTTLNFSSQTIDRRNTGTQGNTGQENQLLGVDTNCYLNAVPDLKLFVMKPEKNPDLILYYNLLMPHSVTFK